MSSALKLFKSLVIGHDNESDDKNPELGFKISHELEKCLKIKIIAAKNLPTSFGFERPLGFLVKVKLYPGKEKYETSLIKGTACPYFDEEFTFPLSSATNMAQFSGKFVTFTIYAILDQHENKTGGKLSSGSFRERMNSLLKRSNSKSGRYSLNNRRTIGAVTFNLNQSVFKDGSTADIWRDVQSISSGIDVQSRESKKGSLEISMFYSNSEDGKHDHIQIALTKFRCSMQTMQAYEKLSGLLYFKMVLYEYDSPVAKWKGNTFVPTISMKIDAKTASMQATINNYNINNIKIVVKLKCRHSVVEKRSQLGCIVIASGSQFWQQLTELPSQNLTQFFEFA